jgi:hypothetical protein
MTRWIRLSHRQLRTRIGKTPSKLQRAFFRVAVAQHYAAGADAVARVAGELLRRGLAPEIIASDLRQLIRPDLRDLVDEIVSACALRHQEAQAR